MEIDTGIGNTDPPDNMLRTGKVGQDNYEHTPEDSE
jgi:hypothetical protein